MSSGTARRTGWALFALSFGLALSSFAMALDAPEPAGDIQSAFASYVTPSAIGGYSIAFLAFSAVGALIVTRRPRNGIGWLFAIDGVLMGVISLSSVYAYLALGTRTGPLRGGEVAAWVTDLLYLPVLGSLTAFLFLLFPDGRLRTSPERTAAVVTAVGVSLGAVAVLLAPNLYAFPDVDNPLGITGLERVYQTLAALSGVMFLGGLVWSIGLLVGRLRRSRGTERDQLRILAASAIASTLLIVPVFVSPDPGALQLIGAWIGVLLIPVSVGVAILRHRLFDIDLVISKAVVFGSLAAFITAVYVGVVVGVGALVGSRGDAILSAIAAATVALAFQPIRRGARRLANRLVYGHRATPYEVLAGFAERVSSSYETDDVLPRMAAILGEGTGAERAGVWLRIGPELRLAASWPNRDERGTALPLHQGRLPRFSESDTAVPVVDRGELLGMLTVTKGPTEPPTPAEERLVRDLAKQAGLVLRNARLLEELRASRQRLVTAQDRERRRLERDIHDGAQQQLVALSVKVRMAESVIEKDVGRARALLSTVQADVRSTLDELRDLARGIYPPLLADEGLAAALKAQARKAAVPVDIRADGIGRYPQEVEATAYFCCLEALQNAAKYAEATVVEIGLSATEGELRFDVRDDGRGFDPETTARGTGLQNMADRLEAIGGSLEIRSTIGGGTTVVGRIPSQGAR